MNNSDLKRTETVMKKYGVDNVSKLLSVQSKRLSTFYRNRPCIHHDLEAPITMLLGSDFDIYRLNKSISDEWLNLYHPLGAPRGTLLSLGLVKDNTIYCIMTFKKSRDKHYNVELSRMWMMPGFYVKDGYNILSDYATQFGLYNIVAYVNLTYESFEEYERIGMTSHRDIQRRKWWIKNDDMISDASRRQKHITTKSLIEAGYHPEWDLGTAVYES